MSALFLVLGALAVAAANGANDNFKGVATLFGSRTASYRTSLAWATLTTFAVGAAARAGLPISTTHAILGALLGAGAIAAGGQLN